MAMKVNKITVEEWTLWREIRLQALEEAPYAFGSTLADWQGEGDQEPRWRSRLENVDFNAIATLTGKNAGMVRRFQAVSATSSASFSLGII